MNSAYWVWVRTDRGIDLGAGFFITSRYILTAAHCLKRVPDKDGTLSVELADGKTIKASIAEINETADLALLDVPYRDAMTTGVVAPMTDRPVTERPWWGPMRPPGNLDPHLAGIVTQAPVDYKLSDGSRIEAAQLTTEVVIGDYSGYSGGPVEARPDRGDTPRIIGLLVEQYFDRQDDDRASNVLWATTMRQACATFRCLEYGGTAEKDASSSAPASKTLTPSEIIAQRPALADNPSGKLNFAFSILSDWHEEGLLESGEVAQLRVQIPRDIIMQMLKDMSWITPAT